MKSHHRARRSRLSRALGWTSMGLGMPQLMAPNAVARAAGVDDSPHAAEVIRVVGARELGHGVLLLRGPARTVWTRVVGDVMDLALLGWAVATRDGERRRRAVMAAATVAAIAAVDVYASVRSSRQGQHGEGRPGPLKLTASTTVNRSPHEVYEYWRDFEKLPTFMRHLESVNARGDGLSHWTATAPLGGSVEWDAELTGDEPGRRISWRSLPGADVDNSGTVHFAPAPDGNGTEVRVVLHYDVPGGTVGSAVAKLVGEEPEQQVRDDLRRFKQVLETGDIVRSEALPMGPDAKHQLLQRAARPHRGDGDGARR